MLDRIYLTSGYKAQFSLFFSSSLKGLLLAWSMRFISLWTAFYDEFLTITASILARVFAHEQQRWCKGVACVIFAFTLVSHYRYNNLNFSYLLEDLFLWASRNIEWWKVNRNFSKIRSACLEMFILPKTKSIQYIQIFTQSPVYVTQSFTYFCVTDVKRHLLFTLVTQVSF